MPRDPVCLMYIDEDVEFKHEHQGKTYYFCSKFCLAKFKEKPEDYYGRDREDPNRYEHDEG